MIAATDPDGQWPRTDFETDGRIGGCESVTLAHIEPGKPAQNAYTERFNRTYREDVLDAYRFNSLQELRYITKVWTTGVAQMKFW